jgi:uncharacterized protein YbcI
MPSGSGRKQEVAEEIVHTIIRSLKERIGRGPEGYRTYFVDDLLIVRLLRDLTPVEYEQAKTPGGRRSIKDTRSRLIQDLRPALEDRIKHLTGANVISVHSDLSTRTGERVIVFVLDRTVAGLLGNHG